MARLVAVVALVAAGLVGAPAARADTSGPTQAVIVEAASVGAASHAVTAVGGTVDRDLALVNGVAAHVSAGALAELNADPSLHVMPDLELHPTSASFDPSGVDTQVAAMDPGADWSPDAGQGVGVALVDTGVADTPDLREDRLVRAPDFSDEGDGIDHYGHGTFVAGLIAGDAASVPITTRSTRCTQIR